MANLFFPQLSTGAMAQYPLKKTRVTRTIINLLPDGSMVLLADANAGKLVWEMTFTELATADAQALQAHFHNCCGSYHAFTFLDPTDNLFANSVDLTNSSWAIGPTVQITSGITDPNGGTNAFMLTNSGDAPQTLSQLLSVPADYQYCFSLYAMSATAATLTLSRQGSTAVASQTFAVGSAWARLTSSGQLNDGSTQFTASISLAPGQQIAVYGLQLEAQVFPSRYRATTGTGGVYPQSHWASDTLALGSDAPNLFSLSFSIQTNV